MGGFPPQGGGGNRDLTFARDSVNVSGSDINVLSAPTSPILDYNIAKDVNREKSNIHTYTATGNFKLSSIEVSAPGSIKIEVKAGDSGSETTKMVAFTSPSRPITRLDFFAELQLTKGQNLLIINTNRENQSMDIYSTILGFNL
jgi:hypothetical protein